MLIHSGSVIKLICSSSMVDYASRMEEEGRCGKKQVIAHHKLLFIISEKANISCMIFNISYNI